MFTKERANQLLHTMMELKLNTELEETVAKELLDAGFKPEELSEEFGFAPENLMEEEVILY